MTQRERVLRALRRAGRQGVASVDFLLPHVCDGGSPITRVASRVDELRQAGHIIEHAGRRNGCVIYRLREPAALARERSGPPDADLGALFEPAPPAPGSPFDPWTDAR